MAASFSISRLISSTATSISISSATKPFVAPSKSLSSSASLAPTALRIRHNRRQFYHTVRTASSSVTAAISVGEKLPDATLSYLDPDSGDVKTITVSSLTAGKKSIIFAVPGAFTPTCSQKHLPGFVEKSSELKSKGVDVIACLSVNDAFVMDAWKKNLGIKDEVLLLSDGNGEFTKKMGCELDLRDKPVGLGIRSKRYSLLAEDGVVKVLNLEEGGAFTSSGADDMLKVL